MHLFLVFNQTAWGVTAYAVLGSNSRSIAMHFSQMLAILSTWGKLLLVNLLCNVFLVPEAPTIDIKPEFFPNDTLKSINLTLTKVVSEI